MAIAVYSIPQTPSSENGARLFKSFLRQSGSKIQVVTPKSVVVLSVPSSEEKVSASTILKARHAKNVLSVVDQAGIQEVSAPILLVQASRKDVAPVYAHTFPIKAKPYPERMPMIVISTTAGIIAMGASPKAATPV